MKGLIIDTPAIDKILEGRKSWEMRSRSTNVRGVIALIRKGSGSAIGVAELVESLGPFNSDGMRFHQSQHLIDHSRLADPRVAKWNHAWVLRNVQKLPEPVRYGHPSGAVIWVNLDDAATLQISRKSRS
jgi:hypothetical protein